MFGGFYVIGKAEETSQKWCNILICFVISYAWRWPLECIYEQVIQLCLGLYTIMSTVSGYTLVLSVGDEK